MAVLTMKDTDRYKQPETKILFTHNKRTDRKQAGSSGWRIDIKTERALHD